MSLSRSVILALTAALIATTPAAASAKKGVGLLETNQVDRIEALHVSWYYTWHTKPMTGKTSAEFVPMLWGGRVYDRQLAELRGAGHKFPTLLVINEPDAAKQSNMSVDDVFRRWPEFSSLADRISSPAAANSPGRWFDAFHARAKDAGVHYSFMALHLYGPPDPVAFLNKLDGIHAEYGMPIWITEFGILDTSAAPWKCKVACVNHYTDEQTLAFMKAVLPELERRPFVERYAWFGAGRFANVHVEHRTSRLFEADGRLTPLGCFYSNFTWPPPADPQETACEAVHVAP